MYEYLLSLFVEDKKCDMAYCNYIEEKEGEEKTIDKDNIIKVTYENEEKYSLIINFKTEDIIMCNKLIRREIFNNLRFNNKRLHEDQWIIPYIIEKSRKIIKSNAIFYHYIMRNESISKAHISPKRMWDLLDALRNTCNLLKNNNLEYYQREEARHLCNYIMRYYEEASSSFENEKEIRKKLYLYFVETMKENKNVFSIKNMIYNSFVICPKMGLFIRRMREKT